MLRLFCKFRPHDPGIIYPVLYSNIRYKAKRGLTSQLSGSPGMLASLMDPEWSIIKTTSARHGMRVPGGEKRYFIIYGYGDTQTTTKILENLPI